MDIQEFKDGYMHESESKYPEIVWRRHNTKFSIDLIIDYEYIFALSMPWNTK